MRWGRHSMFLRLPLRKTLPRQRRLRPTHPRLNIRNLMHISRRQDIPHTAAPALQQQRRRPMELHEQRVSPYRPPAPRPQRERDPFYALPALTLPHDLPEPGFGNIAAYPAGAGHFQPQDGGLESVWRGRVLRNRVREQVCWVGDIALACPDVDLVDLPFPDQSYQTAPSDSIPAPVRYSHGVVCRWCY